MAKIYPKYSLYSPAMASSSSPSTSSTCSFITSRAEVFTIWMKSLVFSSNGCTVYDSNGNIVYRVDNYGRKPSSEVCLMDLHGKVLVTILRKNISVLRFWEGYRWDIDDDQLKQERKKPWFQVKVPCYRILMGDSSLCEVKIVNELPNNDKQNYCYKIEQSASSGKVAYRIVGQAGELIAEVKPKLTTSGIVLGEDVMALVVEPNVDHTLIMSLVVVYSLIHHKM